MVISQLHRLHQRNCTSIDVRGVITCVQDPQLLRQRGAAAVVQLRVPAQGEGKKANKRKKEEKESKGVFIVAKLKRDVKSS